MDRDRLRRVAGVSLLAIAVGGGLAFELVLGSSLVAVLCLLAGVVGAGQLLDSLRLYFVGLCGLAVCALVIAVSYSLVYGVAAVPVALSLLALVALVRAVQTGRVLIRS